MTSKVSTDDRRFALAAHQLVLWSMVGSTNTRADAMIAFGFTESEHRGNPTQSQWKTHTCRVQISTMPLCLGPHLQGRSTLSRGLLVLYILQEDEKRNSQRHTTTATVSTSCRCC